MPCRPASSLRWSVMPCQQAETLTQTAAETCGSRIRFRMASHRLGVCLRLRRITVVVAPLLHPSITPKDYCHVGYHSRASHRPLLVEGVTTGINTANAFPTNPESRLCRCGQSSKGPSATARTIVADSNRRDRRSPVRERPRTRRFRSVKFSPVGACPRATSGAGARKTLWPVAVMTYAARTPPRLLLPACHGTARRARIAVCTTGAFVARLSRSPISFSHPTTATHGFWR